MAAARQVPMTVPVTAVQAAVDVVGERIAERSAALDHALQAQDDEQVIADLRHEIYDLQELQFRLSVEEVSLVNSILSGTIPLRA